MDIELLELDIKASEMCREALKLQDDPESWDTIQHCGKLSAYFKKAYPIESYKMEAFIDKSPEKVIDHLFENWQLIRPAMHDLIDSAKVIKTYNSSAKLISEITRFVPGDEPREIFDFLIKKELTDGTWALVSGNAEHIVDLTTSRFPRADMKMGVQIARPVLCHGNLTHFIAVTQFDPKLSVPQDIIEYIMKARYEFHENLVKKLHDELT